MNLFIIDGILHALRLVRKSPNILKYFTIDKENRKNLVTWHHQFMQANLEHLKNWQHKVMEYVIDSTPQNTPHSFSGACSIKQLVLNLNS